MMKHELIVDNAIPFLEGRLKEHFNTRIISPAGITAKNLGGAEGLLVRTRTRCDGNLLEGSAVKFVATATIGLDHFDIPWLEAHGIDWQNAPGCNAPAVAQYVWRALLELGFKPSEMTLGVVGKGNVGSIVTEWGRRLGANVIVCDPPRRMRGFDDEDYLSLHDLMSRADAVTFHTPLTRPGQLEADGSLVSHPSFHLADAEALAKMRDGGILVNAARGGVVEEAALRALKGEKGLRVAIDTWEGEPSVNPATLGMADIATFHIAGYSRQGKERATYACLEGLERHFGVTLPKGGLAAPYRGDEELSEDIIINSYDIMADDKAFRKNPAGFEHLRDFYALREETGAARMASQSSDI